MADPRPALAPELSPALVEFLESGISVLVGTRDASFRPAAMRASGAKFSADRKRLVVYVAATVGEQIAKNARSTGRLAATFSRPYDHLSYQVKGQVLEVRPSSEADRAVQEQYLARFVAQLEIVGLPREITERLSYWPSYAIELAVDGLYVQTPGPAAGEVFAGGAA